MNELNNFIFLTFLPTINYKIELDLFKILNILFRWDKELIIDLRITVKASQICINFNHCLFFDQHRPRDWVCISIISLLIRPRHVLFICSVTGITLNINNVFQIFRKVIKSLNTGKEILLHKIIQNKYFTYNMKCFFTVFIAWSKTISSRSSAMAAGRLGPACFEIHAITQMNESPARRKRPRLKRPTPTVVRLPPSTATCGLWKMV